MNKDYLIKISLALYRVTELLSEDEPLRFFLREKAGDILEDGVIIFSNGNFLGSKQKEYSRKQLLRNLEVMQSFLEVAQKQEWAKPENFQILRESYSLIREEAKSIKIKSEEEKVDKRKSQDKNKKTKKYSASGENEMENNEPEKNEPGKSEREAASRERNDNFVNFSFSGAEKSSRAEKNARNVFSGIGKSLNPRAQKILGILKEKNQAQIKDVKGVMGEVSKRTLRRDFDFLLKKGLVERVGRGKETKYRIKASTAKF